MMKLFPFLRYASLHNEEYSEVTLPAQNPDSGSIRKAHTVPSLAQTLRPKVSHLEGCVDKRDRERRASFDERYTSSFPTTGGRAAEQRRQNVVAVPAVAPPVRPRRKTMDWCRNGSYISKPTRGWLHSDEQLIEGGVCYGVRYVGCLEVKMSMKSLDFETRTQVAKESITRVCEAAGLKCPDRKRKVEKRISKMLGDRPNMRHAGSNINFTVSTDNLSLVIMESGEIIATHQMQGISFASGGDPETLDFVAYVAKDASGRACYVLECGGGLAQDVITTIGQAFELRFKEYLKKAPKPVTVPNRIEEPLPERSAWGDDPEYYNDMPGKEPPPHPPLPTRTHLQSHPNSGRLEADLQRVPPHEPKVPNAPRNNIGVGGATGFTGDPVSQEMFDPVMPAESPPPPPSRIDSSIHESCPLEEEVWFHRNLSRRQAERLVQRDGDYLVRESSQCPGQYVLTGMQRGQVKHLLLVDPEGVVRTKDRVFESVSHLIDYHRQNRIPITSTESSLHLYNAVISDLSNP